MIAIKNPLRSALFLKSATALMTLSAAALISACGTPLSNSEQSNSSVQTVDINHTKPKWQSIGNCWIYAFASWAESLALTASNGANLLNISETYITYRHYEAQLLSGTTGELETGGFFQTAASITEQFGFMNEGDFIPGESELTFSAVQKAATSYLNASIRSGLLKSDRSPETIRTELDNAFGVTLANLQPKIRNASEVLTGFGKTGGNITLADSLNSWNTASWDKNYQSYPENEKFPAWTGKFTTRQNNLLKRVKLALNAGYPVVLDWFVDFNALNDKGEFSGATLSQKGPGRQGYHSVVVEDYVVEGFNPETGKAFVIGEGQVSEDEMRIAAEYGEIKYFIIKNSWGGSERLDRKSFVRNGEGGYHVLKADYLFAWLQRVNEKTGANEGADTGLSRFVLPPGF